MSPSEVPHRAAGDLSLSPCWAALPGLLASNEQGVVVKDISSGRYLQVNDAIGRLFSREPSSLVGAVDGDIFSAEKATALRAADAAVSVPGVPERTEHRLEIDGRPHDFVVWRVLTQQGPQNCAPVLLALWTEVTHAFRQAQALKHALAQLEVAQSTERELRRQLSDDSLHDPATGLYRQAHFLEQLRREIDLSGREHRDFSLVSLAADPTQAGEPGGPPGSMSPIARQRVLEALGLLLKRNTRAMDASFRLDDEHFAVLLSGVGLATAHTRMDALRRECAGHVVVVDGHQYTFTVSMGVASFPHTATEPDELVSAADKALAHALSRGNHVSLASITLG